MMHFQLNSFETKVSCLDVTVFATCLIVGFLKIPPRGDKSASRGGYFFMASVAIHIGSCPSRSIKKIVQMLLSLCM